ncbi:MAG: tetratricopeptide (TPR) repeat protein [Neolewinella sp.]|jgi:tetratricopeptide (TPR) repeat protein
MRLLHLALLTLLCTCVHAQIPYLQLSPFTTTEEQMQKLITKTLDGPDSGDYSNAGMYALRSDNLQSAVNCFDPAIEEDESPSCWEHLFRAKALAKLGKTAEAMLGAEKCLELATKSDSEYGMTEGKALLDSLRE